MQPWWTCVVFVGKAVTNCDGRTEGLPTGSVRTLKQQNLARPLATGLTTAQGGPNFQLRKALRSH